MDKNTIIVIAMVVLFLVTAAQAVQLTSLKNQLGESGLTIGSSSAGVTTTAASGSSGSSSSSAASSLDNLPGMVGGC